MRGKVQVQHIESGFFNMSPDEDARENDLAVRQLYEDKKCVIMICNYEVP